MVHIFEYEDYKVFLKAWIKFQPSDGRGELRRMAQHLRVHPTLMSHIVNGPKDLSAEQAYELTLYLQLSEQETDYFIQLVQYSKAGTKNLQKHLDTKLKGMRRLSQDLVSKFENKIEMTDAQKGEFYSNWYYSAIHLATDLPDGGAVDSIAKALSLPKRMVKEKLDFLLRSGLCEVRDGRFRLGTAWTHVDARSPYVGTHHRNWRLKAMERHQDLSESELAATAQVSLSRKDSIEIRKKIVALIEDMKQIVTRSKADEIMALNVDWVRISQE